MFINNKLYVSLKRLDEKNSVVSVGDEDFLVEINKQNEKVSVFHDFGLYGVEVRLKDGLYAGDSWTTGGVLLTKVEDQYGNILNF